MGCKGVFITQTCYPDGNNIPPILSSYERTMTRFSDAKYRFYNVVRSIISWTPSTDMLILLGEFNARVRKDHQTREWVIGVEGVRNYISNGLLVLSKFAEHDLLITYTVFSSVTETGLHKCIPDPNTVMVQSQTDMVWHSLGLPYKDVGRMTLTMRGADWWTDHQLVVGKKKKK